MLSFKSWGILWKIMAVIAVLLAAMAASVWTGYRGLHELSADIVELELQAKRVENAGRGTANALSWIRMVESIPHAATPAARNDLAAKAADERRRLGVRIDNLKGLLHAPEAQQRLAAMVQAVQAYETVHRTVLQLAEQGDAAASQQAAVRGVAQAEEIRARIRPMEDAISKEITEFSAKAREDGERATAFMLTQSGIGAAIGLGLAILITLAAISRPLRRMITGMERLAQDDLDIEIVDDGRRDEVGLIGRSLVVFRQNAIDKRSAEANAEAQRAETERERNAREARERQAIAEISTLCERVASGDLAGRLEEADKDGFLLTISQQLNSLTNTLQQMTRELADVTGAMAEGKLTRSVDGAYSGVYGQLKDSVNAMAGKLRDFAARLAETAQVVRNASAEISTASQDLAQRTESQAASIEETAASMHEITTTVKQNADNAEAGNQMAATARNAAEQGGTIMSKVTGAMNGIEESARKIGDIVSLIDEIAFQTNLLALNASVEAARAGEAGKGFAVVAQEVRALAQRSADASKDIKTLISASNSQVKTGADLVGQAGRSLTDIMESVKKVSDIVADIAAASREQATGLDQINTAVGQMDEMTQRNGALVEETSASAQQLATQAQQLAQLVGFFDTGRH
ncbi:methyl-accepting chemotaxis protein [Ferrovibrio terrae]|uniref:methyl-accepting chemotaxis protein n=1 Tax=Ferrovibrio terrae TaxID=2594003 RepID=UPI00313802A6